MSILEDLNFISVPRYASSLKEVLKQTMLSQEVVFRKQVHELHRLHRMQESLMEDSIWKDLNGSNLWKMSTESTLTPFINPIRYSHQPKEKSFSYSSMANYHDLSFSSSPTLESTRYANNSFHGENNSDYSRLQQRTSDLQLRGDQLVNHLGKDLLQERNFWSLRKSAESNHPFDDDTVSFSEVKLTLSFGGDTGKVGINRSTWHEQITQSASHHVINLEESANMASCTDSQSISTPCCAAPITKDKHNLRVHVEANHVSRETSIKKDLSSGLTLSYSAVDSSESCEGQDSFNQGLKERNVDVARNSTGTPLTCSKAFNLDLNIVQLDDSSYLDDSVVASSCLSMDGSSGAFDGLIGKSWDNTCPAATNWGKPKVNCLNESSTILLQDNASASPTLFVPVSRNSHSQFWDNCAPIKEINQTEACSIALKSMSGSTSENCEYLNCDHRNNEIGNTDSLLKFPKRNCTNVITEEVTEIHEDIVLPSSCTYGSKVEDANTGKSLSSCIFDSITDDSSSGTKTMQSGTDFDGSNISLLNQDRRSQSSQSGEQDLRSSESSELKHQCYNKKKEESAAEDILIQNAAESLIHLAVKSSTSNQDYSAKAGLNGIEDEERDMPQHSIDSYESIVLKLTENSAEDYCVSSKHFEVNEMDKKYFGIKWKRGRRLKDFQRDVLPSLASLSSHEIHEDVSVMEAVIRSREYKRMRSRMVNRGENLSAPVKSRRSRLNYVTRRYYS